MRTLGSIVTRRRTISGSIVAATIIASLLLATRAAGACECPKAESCTPTAAHPSPNFTTVPVQHLSGVFVTLRETVPWPATLDQLRCAGITTIIIQTVEEDLQGARDLVTLGAARGMRVFLGLHYEDAFNAGTSDLSTALKRDRALLKRIKRTWSREEKERIGGWYIAEEVHNFNLWREDTSAEAQWDATMRRADVIRRDYLIPLVRTARAVVPKPVIASPQFNPVQDGAVLDARRTGVLFHRIFAGSGVAAIYVQDGLGARNGSGRIGCCTWSRAPFEAQSYAYVRAVANALAGAVTVGVNAESFEITDCVTRTASTGDFRRQLQLPAAGMALVTYELENLLAPDLWRAYLRWIGKGACTAP